jgi:hypothetical protein
VNELDDVRARARVAELRLTRVTRALRELYAAEAAWDLRVRGLEDPCPAWDWLAELEEILQVTLHDGADPWRYVGPPDPVEALGDPWTWDDGRLHAAVDARLRSLVTDPGRRDEAGSGSGDAGES